MSRQMKRVLPDPPPELDYPIGPPGDLTRSYPVGERRYQRLWLGQRLEVEISLPVSGDDCGVVICASDGETLFEQPLENVEDGAFAGAIEFPAPGRYFVRARYRIPDFDWRWDCSPYAQVLVDSVETRDLRMYSMIPAASGPMHTWPERLEAIRDLGCNAVHILPLTPTDYSNSPYAAIDLFGIDPKYLGRDDPPAEQQWRAVVDKAAELELKLCLDLVFNHVGINSRIARERPDWLLPDEDERDGIRRAGWSDGSNWYKWRDLALLDYRTPMLGSRRQLFDHMKAYARHWAGFAAATHGMVRLDNMHSSNRDFLDAVLANLRDAYPGIAVFGELFLPEPELLATVRHHRVDLCLATPWEHHFVPELRSYLTRLHRSGDQVRWFSPVTSHDSGAPAEEFGHPAAVVPRYLVSVLCGSGQGGLCQGTEIGIPERIDFRAGQKTSFRTDHDFRADLRALNGVAASYGVFHRAGNLRFVDDDHEAIIAAWREDEQEGGFLMLANFDIHGRQTLRLDVHRHGLKLGRRHAEDLLGSQLLPDDLVFDLPPCGVRAIRFA